MRTLTTTVKPSVFKWLRESAGWSKEMIAEKLGLPIEIVEEFEGGKKEISFRQIKILAVAYKRPVASFLLSSPKIEKPLPKDYRMLPEKAGVFDTKTIFAIRKARKIQTIGRILLTNIDRSTKSKIERIDLSLSPENLALYYRERFSLSEEKQTKFKTPYAFFGYLRENLEGLNILILQLPMPV
ncbi:MAG: helix-turn-helix transcriptional regulator, partial [archaeon]|nr:helix-turn-helix transcriptional regulator [archaeon]